MIGLDGTGVLWSLRALGYGTKLSSRGYLFTSLKSFVFSLGVLWLNFVTQRKRPDG